MVDFPVSGNINPKRRKRFFKHLLRRAAEFRAKRDVAYRTKFLHHIDHLKSVEDLESVFKPHKKVVKDEIKDVARHDMKKFLREQKAQVVSKSQLLGELKSRLKEVHSKTKSLSQDLDDDVLQVLKSKAKLLESKIKDLQISGKPVKVSKKKTAKKKVVKNKAVKKPPKKKTPKKTAKKKVTKKKVVKKVSKRNSKKK
jgi:small-conductance mechanosensitive channel